MGIADLLIVYLAVGAPIGVLAIARHRKALSRNLIGVFAVNLVLWPIYGSTLWATNADAGRSFDSMNLADRNFDIRGAIDGACNAYGLSLNVQDRHHGRKADEAMDRYASLSEAIRFVETAEPQPSVLHSVTGHPDPLLAAKCQLRRDLGLLRLHQQRVFEDVKVLSVKGLVDETVQFADLSNDAGLDGILNENARV